jgi:DNA topoisomerase-2
MAFVNAVWTPKGGSHVTFVTNQIVKSLEDVINKKKKIASAPMIKNKLMVFINCLIENPSFDSQSKDSLTTKPAQFGSKCVIPASFLKDVVKNSGIVAEFEDLSAHMDRMSLLSGGKAKKGKSSVSHIAKLEDAHLAGTKHALDCSLILTEGDSARNLAVAGIEVVGRKLYGVMPLRGKVCVMSTPTLEYRNLFSPPSLRNCNPRSALVYL